MQSSQQNYREPLLIRTGKQEVIYLRALYLEFYFTETRHKTSYDAVHTLRFEGA